MLTLRGHLEEDGEQWLFWAAQRDDPRSPQLLDLPAQIPKQLATVERPRRGLHTIRISRETAERCHVGRPRVTDKTLFSFCELI